MENSINIDRIRSLAGIYNVSTIKNIVYNNSLSTLNGRLKRYKNLIAGSDENITFEVYLKLIYGQMISHYCNEYIYKNSLTNQLLIEKYGLETTTLLSEFRIGKSISDMILINGEVKLFEIKTDLDNFNRLEIQLNEYKKAVEKIYIVTSSKYVEIIKSNYSNSNYGIIELTETMQLRIHKEANSDKSNFSYETIFKLLRKDDYLQLVQDEFNFTPNVPNTVIFKECFDLCRQIEITKLQKAVFLKLKKRKISHTELLMKEEIPKELKFLCYLLNFDESNYDRLFSLLKVSI